MHIKNVELRNFKRFTNLTIDGIPADTKLVLLIGSNGSGKSSVFDAFEVFNSASKVDTSRVNRSGQKAIDMALSSRIGDRIKTKNESCFLSITTADSRKHIINSSDLVDPTFNENSFYGRTSFRQVSRLVRRQTNSAFDIEIDSDRPLNFIDRENRFENDIDRISGQILRELFRDNSTAEQIRATYIGAINDAFKHIFGTAGSTTLSLFEILPPLEGKPAQINFRKGDSEIPYDYLSAGEKEVLNILMNLLVRREYFTDTVYFFDEIDLHLNTKLQFNLLKEITENWIPENCQLWTASHSLGFIDYARQYDKGVIIDFDDLDFDQPQTLFPQPKEQLDVYDIAIPKEMLFEIMKDKKLILCENQNDEYYNLLGLPNVVFVPQKDARSIFLQVRNDPRFYALRDRDFLSDTEIERIEKIYPNYSVLRYYDFENYLYHPNNMAELNLPDFSLEAYQAEILRQKKERFTSVLLNLKASRSTYEELKTGDVMDKIPDSIVDDLQSDEFERYYKYFDMKDAFNKSYLTRLNLDKKRLVQTNWFRQQISTILNR